MFCNVFILIHVAFSGVVGRRYSVSTFPRYPLLKRAYAACSTTNGSAKTSGANTTVNGYLIYILYSVVLLARASHLSLRKPSLIIDA